MATQAKNFEQLAAYQYWSASLGTRSGPELVLGVRVTSEFFNTLGVAPAQGRTFLPEEQEPRQNRVLF